MDQFFTHGKPVTLESGFVLTDYTVAYQTFGTLNASASNVVWVCHALTANADVFEWWPGLFGKNDLFNPAEHFIVCANVLGSCYGTTGPLSKKPDSEQPWYHDFPVITVRDQVLVHMQLALALNISSIALLIGGSLGGQQALEWAVQMPLSIGRLVLLATNAVFSPWGIAINEAQRMAIEADSTWRESQDEAGGKGLMAARAMALISYRHYRTFQEKQAETDHFKTDGYLASSYQRYQGLKLLKRFNAFSYHRLSKAMDSHHIARGRGSTESVLASLHMPALVIGLSSDMLFPIAEQEFLAHHLGNGRLAVIDSLYGHDGFLIETPTISRIISNFLKQTDFPEIHEHHS